MQFDQSWGAELRARLEPALSFSDRRKFEEPIRFLNEMASRLVSTHPVLQYASIDVQLVEQATWQTFSVPGRIYVPRHLLQTLEFENEWAAVLSFELGVLARRFVAERLRAEDYVSAPEDWRKRLNEISIWFGPGGVYRFSSRELKSALEPAVDFLYRANYDVRGLASLWQAYRRSSSFSPYTAADLEGLIETTRDTTALYTPTINPIVRSARFVQLQKRIRNL